MSPFLTQLTSQRGNLGDFQPAAGQHVPLPAHGARTRLQRARCVPRWKLQERDAQQRAKNTFRLVSTVLDA